MRIKRKSKRIISDSPKKTGEIAKEFLAHGTRVFALKGELGSGKTTFVQGLARQLGIKRRVTSPTFILMQRYAINLKKYPYKNLYHIDAYRVSKKSLEELGIKDILCNPENVVAIEWAEKIKGSIPRDGIWISFSHHKDPRKRTIIL